MLPIIWLNSYIDAVFTGRVKRSKMLVLCGHVRNADFKIICCFFCLPVLSWAQLQVPKPGIAALPEYPKFKYSCLSALNQWPIQVPAPHSCHFAFFREKNKSFVLPSQRPSRIPLCWHVFLAEWSYRYFLIGIIVCDVPSPYLDKLDSYQNASLEKKLVLSLQLLWSQFTICCSIRFG